MIVRSFSVAKKLASTNQRAGHHVVQALFVLSESNDDIPDHQDDRRQNLREMPPGGAQERDPVPRHVRNLHTEDHLAKRCLLGRTLHPGFIEPVRPESD